VSAVPHRFPRGGRPQNSLPIGAPRLAKGAVNFNSRPSASLKVARLGEQILHLAANRWTAFNSGASCKGVRLVAQVVRFPLAFMHFGHDHCGF